LKKFKIYSANYCDFCKQAITLLMYKGAHFEVIDIAKNEIARDLLKERTGCATIPQIFLDGKFIGGCTHLLAMDESGELDSIIKGEEK